MKKRRYKAPAIVALAGIMSSALIVTPNGSPKDKTVVTAAGIPSVYTEKTEVMEEITEVTEVTEYTEDTECAEQSTEHYPEFEYSKDWDYEDSYLLAKIAMAEAEGESVQTKTLIILTVLNRVHSDKFPDTIEEVIFEKHQNSEGKTIYQFSPVMPGGRWWTTEPNDECWEAVEVVMTAQYDYSGGALYFESCDCDSWHSKNLNFLYQSGKVKFYN